MPRQWIRNPKWRDDVSQKQNDERDERKAKEQESKSQSSEKEVRQKKD
tara:strand:+ start:17498 stop:17641 length:144 start_codon:yes stop_codon:yes gene_type:complete